MKAQNLIKILIVFFAISFITFLFHACKKSPSSFEQERKDLVELYKEKLKDQPATFTQVLNLSGKGYYGDINGSRITKGVSVPNIAAIISCPEPGESEFSTNFYSMFYEFTCGVGYRFNITYKIVSEFSPIMQISSTQFSFGKIRIKNSSGTVIFTTTQANRYKLLDIVNNGVVGQNSLGADLHEFTINFRTEYITASVFSSAAAIEPMFYIYTDCPNYPTQQVPFTAQQSAPGYQQLDYPCTRIDKMYWNPRNGSTPPSISGSDPCLCFGNGCYSYSYIFPTHHNIEFKNGAGDWKSFYLFVNGMGRQSVLSPSIRYFDIFYIDVPTTQTLQGLVPGNVQVRYRNNHTSSTYGGPCTTQPDGTYIFETWYIN